MKMRWLAACSAAVLVASAGVAQAQDVRAMQKEAFAAYLEENQRARNAIQGRRGAFAEIRTAYREAARKYRANISRKWPETTVSSPKRWVRYTLNFDLKTEVDFVNDRIRISRIMDAGADTADAMKEIAAEFQNLANLTYEEAYASDPVSTEVEDRLRARVNPEVLVGPVSLPDAKVPLLSRAPSARRMELMVDESVGNGKQVVYVEHELGRRDVSQRQRTVRTTARQMARQMNVPEALILALTETETNFNPLAVSPDPAFGLMQIVPRAAGRDITNYVYGDQKLLTPKYLFNPQNNIIAGATYLRLLYIRSFRKVENAQSKAYCAIAAYNAGAGAVAVAMNGERSLSKAAVEINKRNPEQLLQYLTGKMPAKETRDYLARAAAAYKRYR